MSSGALAITVEPSTAYGTTTSPRRRRSSCDGAAIRRRTVLADGGWTCCQATRRSGPARPACLLRAAKRPVEDKESLRWITGAQAGATALAGRARSLIVVADQDGDVYSHFARCPLGSDLLVRARHDRALVEGGGLQDKTAWPVTASGTVEVPARPGQPARTARVTLQAGPVEVARPSGLGAREPVSLSLSGVCVQERDPPAGVAPRCWRLLTTRAVPDAAAAHEMVRLYRLRWRIEEVFRALKRDGLKLEATQVRMPDKLFRLGALALGAAVRILQLVDSRDGGRRPMQDVLDEIGQPLAAQLGRACDGSTARLRNPHPAGSLGWLTWIVARHGGWNTPNSPPGPKVIARGWEHFSALLAGAILATESNPLRP